MQREVFEPFRITRSALGAAPIVCATGHPGPPWMGMRLPAYEQSTIAASSVFASAEDLVRFGLLHVKALAPGQRKILSDGSIDAMQQRIAPSPFGMGWFVFDGRASGVVFHGGGMDAVSTVIFLVPARRLVVAGLCSTMIDLPGRAAAEIIHRLAPGVRIEPPYRLRFHLRRTKDDRLAGPVSAWSFRSGRGADILPTYAVLHRQGARQP